MALPTLLDQAYQAATRDPNKRIAFYDLLLSTRLYFPVYDMPGQEGVRRAGDDEQVRPILFDVGGNPHLMLFDSREKLNNWAQREVGVVGLTGYVVAEISAPQWHWGLNPGTPFSRVIGPQEIAWLKQRVATSAKEVHVPAGAKVMLGSPAPDRVPAGLEETLSKTLARNPEVAAAYLGMLFVERPGEAPHLIVVIRASTSDPSTLEAIRRDVGTAATPFSRAAGGIDVQFESEFSLAQDLARKVPAFFLRNSA